jgi:segregation and condensation protein A
MEPRGDIHHSLAPNLYSHPVAVAVETPVFEGPLDLLLHLILSEEVDLYDVRLSDIVTAYLASLAQMEEMNLEIATEFVLIAATLIELKSKRLLPDESDIDLDEELALWEERDLLLSRLVECKTFKDAASAMAVLLASSASRAVFASRITLSDRSAM